MNNKRKNKAFTLVELLVVIAILAILATVSIVGYTSFIKKANESNALTESAQKWILVSSENLCSYEDFIDNIVEAEGWYYDLEDDVLKYNFNNEYTVIFDGKDYEVVEYDNSDWNWEFISEASVDYAEFELDATPKALIVTYYSDINSRGFSWMTNTDTSTELYVVESNLGENADFSKTTVINGTSSSTTGYYAHKVHIENLKYGTVYSYKVGGAGNYKYGTFKVDNEDPESITVIQLSDAQTKNISLLNVWENTFAQAVETAGRSLDFVLYNGDQYDSNAEDDYKNTKTKMYLRYSIARDTISDYLDSVPYMTTSGNHEPLNDAVDLQYYNNDVDYGSDGSSGYSGVSDSTSKSNLASKDGCYYSFDYGNTHFIVLNTNDIANGNDQLKWLEEDLKSTDKKWKVVTMHIGAYATGDHSNGVSNIITNLTPLFSKYHVDLVLQAHDHTYNKTLPYLWDSTGYTTTYDNSKVVNLNPSTITIDDEVYDYNPNGTYYVTTGAAGHRYGASEYDAGYWADVTFSDSWKSSTLKGVIDYSGYTFTKNTYKIEVGSIMYDNSYDNFNGTKGSYSYTSDQTFEVGDPATGNVNATMFGILTITDNTLTYDFYTVNENDVRLFDSLNVYKD